MKWISAPQFLAATTYIAAVHTVARTDVALEDLESVNAKLTDGVTVTAVDPNDWLTQCVPIFQANGFGQNINYSNYYLIDKPAGLCADFLTCAYPRCFMTAEEFVFLNATDISSSTAESYEESEGSGKLPPLNLPGHISFPKSVKDIVEVVKFAGDHCLTVSIKNGGHSYVGSSTMKDSIQLNLRDLQRYSNTSIELCSNDTDADDGP